VAAPGPDEDNAADEKNNEIGLRLADKVESEAECKKRVHEMWEAGELAIRPDYESAPTSFRRKSSTAPAGPGVPARPTGGPRSPRSTLNQHA
jgi:hypothetical protein